MLQGYELLNLYTHSLIPFQDNLSLIQSFPPLEEIKAI